MQLPGQHTKMDMLTVSMLGFVIVFMIVAASRCRTQRPTDFRKQRIDLSFEIVVACKEN